MSCDVDDFLEVTPTGQTLLETVVDYENFMIQKSLDIGPNSTIAMSDDL